MSNSIRVILASGSPRRKEILERHGVSFEVIKSTCPEETRESAPDRVVCDLSMQKARDVADRLDCQEPCIIIAADTVVASQGKILGKPVDEQDACRMIEMLQDDSHQVYTGVSVLSINMEEVKLSFAQCTQVMVYPMTQEEIQAYVATGEPMDKAGAYGIQGRFGVFIKGIQGDYDNVVGLPVARLYQETKNIKGLWL